MKFKIEACKIIKICIFVLYRRFATYCSSVKLKEMYFRKMICKPRKIMQVNKNQDKAQRIKNASRHD